ncbi:MAG: trypsin-like serine protease [Opitutales bacterium]|nr:trypsin-like serine protease [Opitutales bacterium]MCH8541059.1 trypsin-like serine protease [Opitutales bacterium]
MKTKPYVGRYGIFPLLFVFFLSSNLPLHGLIFFNHGNEDTEVITNPGNGVPWENAGAIYDANGNLQGSSVYLGSRYVLTADHVSVGSSSTVSFDGNTHFSIDGSSPVQVSANVDLKLFRLQNDPGFAGVSLASSNPANGTALQLVGFGRGRGNTGLGEDIVDWGGSSTQGIKRTGTNNVFEIRNQSWSSGTYSQSTLVTQLNNDTLNTEAAGTIWDSGGPVFALDSSEEWVLVGILAAVTRINGSTTSTFANNPEPGESFAGDENWAVNIAAYEEAILAIIPEPSLFATILGILFFGYVLRKRSLVKR